MFRGGWAARRYAADVVRLAALALVAVTCPAGPVDALLTQAEAVEIARRDVSFSPDSVEAVLLTVEARERPVWQVTFRGRLPGQPPGLFETMIVEVDAATGEVVSLSRT